MPYVTSSRAFPLLFVIAVWATRHWVVREELRLPRRLLAAVGVVFVVVSGSYGLVHPVWIETATAWSSPRTGKRPTVLLILRNAGRVSVEVKRLSGGLVFSNGTRLRYRVFGLSASEPLLTTVSGLRRCS